MDKKTPAESREKVREFLKAQGKDPDKLMPKGDSSTKPESTSAGAASSPENQKDPEAQAKEKEQKEQESRAASEAQKAEEAKKAEEEKKLLDAKDETLSDAEKARKKEILSLKELEKEAQKEARIQKRIDDLVGQLKAEKAERDQDKQRIASLENQIKQLNSGSNSEKAQEDLRRLEADRLKKYEEEDKTLPRGDRREMTRAELEEWFVEDMVSAQEWLTQRELRRRDERARDAKPSVDQNTKEKVDMILQKQRESRDRVSKKHPELDISKRMADLKTEGKSQDEIQRIILGENPKVKIMSEVMREHPEFEIAENGPELLAAEMEKRMAKGSNHQGETEDEKEARLRQEGAEAERQRQAAIDAGLKSTRGASHDTTDEKGPLYNKQLAIFRRAFPNLSEADCKARLDKRLKAMGAVGVT